MVDTHAERGKVASEGFRVIFRVDVDCILIIRQNESLGTRRMRSGRISGACRNYRAPEIPRLPPYLSGWRASSLRTTQRGICEATRVRLKKVAPSG